MPDGSGTLVDRVVLRPRVLFPIVRDVLAGLGALGHAAKIGPTAFLICSVLVTIVLVWDVGRRFPRARLTLSPDRLQVDQKGRHLSVPWHNVEAIAYTSVVKLWLPENKDIQIEGWFPGGPRKLADLLVAYCRSVGNDVDFEERPIPTMDWTFFAKFMAYTFGSIALVAFLVALFGHPPG